MYPKKSKMNWIHAHVAFFPPKPAAFFRWVSGTKVAKEKDWGVWALGSLFATYGTERSFRLQVLLLSWTCLTHDDKVLTLYKNCCCKITQGLFENFDQERSCVIEQEPFLSGVNPFLSRCEHHIRQAL